MCGRVTLVLDQITIMEVLKDIYDVENKPELPEIPAYNIGPSDRLLSVIESGGKRRSGLLTWGLVPSWTKEEALKHSLINARSETVAEKPSFREAFARRRCILLASHFYEWKREGEKRPFLFEVKDQPVMAFAGIYNVYKKADGSRLSSCAILTCEPNELMAPIHHRMPVILDKKAVGLWLDPTAYRNGLEGLMRPYDPSLMQVTEVSTYVNNIKNKGPKCIEPL